MDIWCDSADTAVAPTSTMGIWCGGEEQERRQRQRGGIASARALAARGRRRREAHIAEREDGEWICLESNDGGASGPAPEQDLVEFWRTLSSCLQRLVEF